MKKIKEFYKENKGTIDKIGVVAAAVAIIGGTAIAFIVGKREGIEIGMEEGFSKMSPAQWSAKGRHLNFMKSVVNVA